MKNRTPVFAALLTLCAWCTVQASGRPDFSGTWVLDKNKSFSNQPGLEQTMTITHTGDVIKLTGKQKSARGEVDLDEAYTIDGTEGDFTPLQQGQNAKGRRKASWLPQDKGILIVDAITTETPDGPATQHITRKWKLSGDGRTLTVDYFFDGPRGSFESRRVFNRKTETP